MFKDSNTLLLGVDNTVVVTRSGHFKPLVSTLFSDAGAAVVSQAVRPIQANELAANRFKDRKAHAHKV